MSIITKNRFYFFAENLLYLCDLKRLHMSEFTNNALKRAKDLSRFMQGLIDGESGAELVKKYNLITENYIPIDVLAAFDIMFDHDVDIEKLKTASNKLFNILYKTLSSYDAIDPKINSFIYFLIKDNQSVDNQLKNIKPLIKEINKNISSDLLKELADAFKKLQEIDLHYTVKENVLFPVLEKHWKKHQCLKLMWSFHDDIRQNLKITIESLEAKEFDLKHFNKISSLVFFNIYTIIFREEKILFPIMKENIELDVLDDMLRQCHEMGLPFVKTKYEQKTKMPQQGKEDAKTIKLETGEVSLQEMEMIFKHLPVDITYVDENDTVKFYSDPPHRIFPRTSSIIGRKVQNCHPPESVGVVEQIVEAFRKGEKDEASFWIHMGPKFVLIRYFAVRDNENNFRGTLEVSQEISEIQKLEGDRRLLDW